MEMAAIDPATAERLAPGEVGEIVVRGTAAFSGYWNDPDQTAAALTADRWFRSGDLGFVDADGRVSYRGRLKEMIKVGGENVSAMEVEVVLARHPDVAVVAVVGVPDEQYTEVPAAFVELHPGSAATAEDLLAHCRAALARFKVPRHLRFVDDWPMSATKIRKTELRRRLVEERSPAS
jgi:fatty-acyl-CoA synthase